MTKKLDRLVMIGLGLIGGSLAKAVKERKLCNRLVGCSRSHETLVEALKLGIVDETIRDINELPADLGANDLVVIAVPTLSVKGIIIKLHKLLDRSVTITDVSSVKESIVKCVFDIYGFNPPQFVPGHPIAGSEKSGINSINSLLFEDHQVILTPLNETSASHIKKVSSIWTGVGATVSEMSTTDHDEILAATSHLPHMLAYGLVDMLSGIRKNQDAFRYAAGGFSDFTRIAASDPVMWHDIVLANDKAVLSALDNFSVHIDQIKQAIANKDGKSLIGIFTRAKDARNHFKRIREDKAYTEPTEKIIDYRASSGGNIKGTIKVPGDKSISHRAIILGSIAKGTTYITGFLEGEDSLATLQAFRDMGVVIEGPNDGNIKIYGVGLNGLKQPPGPLCLGNSGTSMRLLSGLLSAQLFDVVLTGDESLSKRPMGRVVTPLKTMGAFIEADESGLPPLKIKGNQVLNSIYYELPMASAQVKSCILLAGLYIKSNTIVKENATTRDHTERMLSAFGCNISKDNSTITIKGGNELISTKIDVPADISSAAFFIVAASIAPGSDIILPFVGVNPTRIGVINILKMMGADIELSKQAMVGGEPVADIRVRYAPLRGIVIPSEQVALAIDEFPALFIAAACADGKTTLNGASELRFKESDRIQAMADGLLSLGINLATKPDGIEIQGGTLSGGEIDSNDDHRISMAFSIAALISEDSILIKNCKNVATSFPNFIELANKSGMTISEVLR